MKCLHPTQFHKILAEKITKAEMWAFLFGTLAMLLLYFQTIAGEFYCGDGNLCGSIYRPSVDYEWEEVCGRFLIRYVAKIRSLFIFGPLTVIISFLFVILGTLLICRLLRIDGVIAKVVSILTVILYPVFADTLTYRFTADSYMLSFLLAAIAVWIFWEKQNVWRGIVAAILLLAVLNLYQAYFFLAPALWVALFIRDLLTVQNAESSLTDKAVVKRSFLKLVFAGAASVISMILYFIMVKTMSPYTSRLEYSTSIDLKALPGQTGEAYLGFFRIFIGDAAINNSWRHRGTVNLVLLIIGVLLVGWLLYRRKKSKLTCLGAGIAVLILPVFVNGISILNFGTVTLIMLPTMVLPYLFLLSVWEAVKREADRSEKRDVLTAVAGWTIWGALAYILVVMVVYMGIYQMVQNYYAEKTHNLAQRIVTSLEMTYPEINSQCYVFIYGGVNNDNQPEPYTITMAGFTLRGTLAHQQFNENVQGYTAWNKILEERMGVSYKMYGIADMEEYIQSDEFKELPIYPQEGSVHKIREGCYFVKLRQ
ncbi:MAG: glucosyltransferase domain-containing protein [Lachnospiraceae bacterium]|nr:glucosyltransferase domain-containing protein [Lachnospiraceae bacterium]